MTWERSRNRRREKRFRNLRCRFCKQSGHLGNWYVQYRPKSCHNENVRNWLMRNSYDGLSFYKHKKQPPTATIDLFGNKIYSVRSPVSMDVGKKRQRMELFTNNTNAIRRISRLASSKHELSVSVQCYRCAESRDIHFSMLWERPRGPPNRTHARFKILWCFFCKQSKTLARWYVRYRPGNCHNEDVRYWLN